MLFRNFTLQIYHMRRQACKVAQPLPVVNNRPQAATKTKLGCVVCIVFTGFPGQHAWMITGITSKHAVLCSDAYNTLCVLFLKAIALPVIRPYLRPSHLPVPYTYPNEVLGRTTSLSVSYLHSALDQPWKFNIWFPTGSQKWPWQHTERGTAYSTLWTRRHEHLRTWYQPLSRSPFDRVGITSPSQTSGLLCAAWHFFLGGWNLTDPLPPHGAW